MEKKKRNENTLRRKKVIYMQNSQEIDNDSIIYRLLNPGWVNEEQKKSNKKNTKKEK